MALARRLLFWTDCFWPTIGGSEAWSRSFVTELQADGWDVRVVAFDNELTETIHQTVDGIEILRPPMRAGFQQSAPAAVRDGLRALAELLDRFVPDCIQINGQRAETLLTHSLALRKLRLPTLLTFHSEWPEAQIGPGSLIDRLVREADRISVFDPCMTGWVGARWPAVLHRVSCVPHALMRPACACRPAPANGPIAYCGRLSFEKGVDIAIAAFARILPDYPEARLIIAGDGDQRAALESQVRDLGIGETVSFRGWIDPGGVEDILDGCAFAIQPSRLESFGLYALEAAWRGRAVIAAATGGLPGHIDDGETGLLVPPDSIDDLAAAMRRLLADPVLAARMGAAGRRKAEQRPDWRQHVAALKTVLEEVMCNDTRGAG